ncbi:hypothetical protein [Chengkuizengella axinellae]|uniref:Uncharacterized protein n=1 Tax=Chengkuizengella axinellae TaxID=3064388 RepID=A0ABT9IX81_9BACL|nr:hypothetical protein [Chengkuizengella sp. 2205SS18-9]MDP5273722.1 hypothetical protein [Chengkuizengella sp. 2205SS18-9]
MKDNIEKMQLILSSNLRTIIESYTWHEILVGLSGANTFFLESNQEFICKI